MRTSQGQSREGECGAVGCVDPPTDPLVALCGLLILTQQASKQPQYGVFVRGALRTRRKQCGRGRGTAPWKATWSSGGASRHHVAKRVTGVAISIHKYKHLNLRTITSSSNHPSVCTHHQDSVREVYIVLDLHSDFIPTNALTVVAHTRVIMSYSMC